MRSTESEWLRGSEPEQRYDDQQRELDDRQDESVSTQHVRALWIGQTGKPLGLSQMAQSLIESTRTTLGVEVSPHLFRASAATTAAVLAPQMPFLASALLHHARPAVTQEHYNRATSFSVARDFAEMIQLLRQV